MASLIYLDTHVVAWLYAYGRDAVPQRVGHLLEQSDDICISPMVYVVPHLLESVLR